MNSFSNINALIIDMDGVLWHGNQALPGLTDFFDALRAHKIAFVLATNNASQTPQQYISKLASMGVTVDEHEILTSAMATAHYLSEQFTPAETRIFVIGETGTRTPLLNLGYTLTEIDEINADIVVCGLDKQLTWKKLATAALNLQNGAHFIATNADTTLPTEQGFVPGNGATLAALQQATGIHPVIIGKPETNMYQQALRILNTSTENTLVIGDRLDTDILGAVKSNIPSVMVLSGISTRKDIEKVDYQPNWVMKDIREITSTICAKLN